MCGIIGSVGKNNVLPVLINGLKRLEYRGYDSAGIAYNLNNDIKIVKEKGKIANLEALINFEDDSKIGIGHTRWATHGEANTINAHPHRQNNITIVHNGIIENYIALKNELIEKGYVFKSETDTEVACAYIDYLYSENKDILKTLNSCTSIFKGSYAIVVMVDGDNENLYVIKKDSPLIIGIGDDNNYIASDIGAIINYTNKYYTLDDYEYASVNKDSISIYKNGDVVSKEIKEFKYDVDANDKGEYDHYMLKEINEQPLIIRKLVNKYFEGGIFKSDLLPDIEKFEKIYIVGCGSAYHAGVACKYLFEEYGDVEVIVELASEFRYKKLFLNDKCLVIAISQSGETADTLASLKIAREFNCYTIGIVNVYESSIARFVDRVIYTEAGSEIAVATTKGYLTQVFILSLLALKLGIIKNNIADMDKVCDSYKNISTYLESLVCGDYKKIANKLYEHDDIFFLGRNIDYALMLEGSLKLKEISYIHAECYAAGELKHGTISLIDKGTPVIGLITKEDIADKTISNIKEVIARGAYVILIVKDSIEVDKCYNDIIMVPSTTPLLQPILSIIPLQLISYEVAKARDCDIDKPRNLAKSVTVE